jgi:DNA-binding response OmpR family regulator
MRILVIDNDRNAACGLENGLKDYGCQIEVCGTGLAGLEKARTDKYDAIVLDILLPGLDGIKIVRALRERNSSTAVFFVTARQEIDERVEGFNAEADAYLAKPCAVEELVALLRAIQRRKPGGVFFVMDAPRIRVVHDNTKQNPVWMLGLRDHTII